MTDLKLANIEKPVFEYTNKDFIANVDVKSKLVNPSSKFDQFIRVKWKIAMQNGFFRYNLDDLSCRILTGTPQYILQLNPHRGSARRQPEVIEQLSTPFDGTKFNFNKVKHGEILGYLHDRDACHSHENSSDVGQLRRHLLLINVSPLEFGHILLVPDAEKCLPQKLTLLSLKLSIDVLLLSNDRGMRLAFNSLCALASVNHLHVHAWYMDYQLTLERLPVVKVYGSLYETTTLPVNAFVLQLGNLSTTELAQQIFHITDYLQDNEIAHNVFFTRGTVFNCDDQFTPRVYIWPRKKHIGDKMACSPSFNIAVAELAGHVPVYDDTFYTLTHAEVNERVRSSSLDLKQYDELKQKLTVIFQNIDM